MNTTIYVHAAAASKLINRGGYIDLRAKCFGFTRNHDSNCGEFATIRISGANL